MKVKEESGKAGLQLKIQKTKMMASGPITSWQIDGENVEIVTDFIFLGSKITVYGDCTHEILLFAPWKKSYDKSRQCTKKQRHHIFFFFGLVFFPNLFNISLNFAIKSP